MRIHSLKGLIILPVMLLSICLVSCSNNQQKKSDSHTTQETMTVEKKPVYKNLYFSGTLFPDKQVSVTAPNDAVVLEKDFQYGQKVKKGQLLYVLQSSKQASQFQSDLASYLKAKQQLNSDYGKLQSSKSLHKKGLISDDDYQQAKSSYYLSELSLLQAQSQLKSSLKYYQFDSSIFSLSISDIKEISKTISKSLKAERIHIKAPATGIALLPSQNNSDSSDSDNSNTITTGSQVKDGQVLVTIGLLQGLAMKAQANEININQLKEGLKATITSVAFPNVTLHGEIKNIAAQAVSSSSLPVFNIRIVVPKLDNKQRQVVKVGMSAKAQVKIKQSPKITIPIAAVFKDSKSDQTMVTKLVDGKAKPVPVSTGETSVNKVVILSGLKPGDKIVTNHQAQ